VHDQPASEEIVIKPDMLQKTRLHSLNSDAESEIPDGAESSVHDHDIYEWNSATAASAPIPAEERTTQHLLQHLSRPQLMNPGPQTASGWLDSLPDHPPVSAMSHHQVIVDEPMTAIESLERAASAVIELSSPEGNVREYDEDGYIDIQNVDLSERGEMAQEPTNRGTLVAQLVAAHNQSQDFEEGEMAQESTERGTLVAKLVANLGKSNEPEAPTRRGTPPPGF
jgi:hypothetical protein